jgi:hypothetical protein
VPGPEGNRARHANLHHHTACKDGP